jgi:hypothetical protein
MNIPEEIAGQVATAVRTIATMASARLGADCIWHALACQHLLAIAGIDDTRVVAGYAAWRVDGQDPGAVVCHHVEGSTVAVGTGGFLFHAWLSCGRQVFDATTYQFRQKLAELDVQGTIDGASVHPREVIRRVIETNAAAVIFAHNHPSGVTEPSQADLRITQRLKDALALIDVRVLDHLIVGEGEANSLAERGLL